MTFIAIEIEAKGKTCVGCEFMHNTVRCPFYPDNDLGKIVENNKAGIGLDFFSKKPTRFPGCIAATIPENCRTCDDFDDGDCNMYKCRRDNFSHWKPPKSGN